MEELRELWETDFEPTHTAVKNVSEDPRLVPLKWEDVKMELHSAAAKIQVRGINGDAGGVLDYDSNPSGLTVIAVGGDKLSRGLTLEGLSVSYYVRPAKNYDTLLQMGRWFGYRSGYLDLCRLFTSEELEGWYQHIAVANEELRREFTFMELSHLTPEDYGLKVRTSPDGLNITAANKIRNGRRMRVSFAGHLAQTTIFHKEATTHQTNFRETESWLLKLPGARPSSKRIVWNDVPPNEVIHFLKSYTTHPLCRQAEPDLLIKYIQKLNGFEELMDWTVALISNSERQANRWEIAGHSIGLIKRTDATPDHDLYMLKNANILNPQDEGLDFSDEQLANALAENIAEYHKGNTRLEREPSKPSGPFIRRGRPPQKGLLMIYPLDHTCDGEHAFSPTPIIGFAISFPASPRGEQGAIEYEVNTKYWNERYGGDDDDV
jgi:hypothetical protein